MNYDQVHQLIFTFIRNKKQLATIIALETAYNKMIMRYFLCFLCPPIAILSTGRVGSFVLNIILTIFFWIPGIIHAILVVNDYYEDRRFRRYARETRRGW